MAEGDAMEAAQERAKKLIDQAAALREGMPPAAPYRPPYRRNQLNLLLDTSKTLEHSAVG